MKLGIRRELGLYADSIANYGARIAHDQYQEDDLRCRTTCEWSVAF